MRYPRSAFYTRIGLTLLLCAVLSTATHANTIFSSFLSQSDARLMDKRFAKATEQYNCISQISDPDQLYDHFKSLWHNLQASSVEALKKAEATTSEEPWRAWCQLALLVKLNTSQPQTLSTELQNWQSHYPNHLANHLFNPNFSLNPILMQPPEHIALLLPLHGKLADAGRAVREGFLSAYFADNHPNKPKISIHDSAQPVNVSKLYTYLIQSGVDRVVGPLSKYQVDRLSRLKVFPIPTLTLNETTHYLTAPQLFQFSLSANSEAKQVAKKVLDKGYRNALIIAPHSPWGQNVANAFSHTWEEHDGRILEEILYQDKDSLKQQIRNALGVDDSILRHHQIANHLSEPLSFVPRRRQDMDVIILFAPPTVARQIRPLLKFYFAGQLPIYASSFIFSGNLHSPKDRDLLGIQFIDMPFLLDATWRPSFNRTDATHHLPRLYAMGIDAYQLIQALPAMTQLPYLTLPGRSGQLSMSDEQHIKRDLDCGKFTDEGIKSC